MVGWCIPGKGVQDVFVVSRGNALLMDAVTRSEFIAYRLYSSQSERILIEECQELSSEQVSQSD